MASPCPTAGSSGPFKDVAWFPGGAWPCANAGSSKPFKDVARFPGRAGPGGNAGSSRPFKDVARFPLFLCSIRSIIQILIHDSSALLFLNKKYHRSSIS